MRMDNERKLKQAVFEMFRAPRPGDLLMDAPKVKSWHELRLFACDKEYWKARVRSMRQQPVVRVDIDKHVESDCWAPFTVSSYVGSREQGILSCKGAETHPSPQTVVLRAAHTHTRTTP